MLSVACRTRILYMSTFRHPATDLVVGDAGGVRSFTKAREPPTRVSVTDLLDDAKEFKLSDG